MTTKTTQEKLVSNDIKYQTFIHNLKPYRATPFSAFRLYKGDTLGLLKLLFPIIVSELVVAYAGKTQLRCGAVNHPFF
jgi:hypothetical protein